jgi:ribosomal protein S18 acetylase RimI-like enzyme
VFRQIEMWPARFQSFLTREAKRLGVAEEAVAAWLMGRHQRSEGNAGTSLMVDGPAEELDFIYGHDPEGLVCPLGAHIRRANRRDSMGREGRRVNRHRIIRRGMPYHRAASLGRADVTRALHRHDEGPAFDANHPLLASSTVDGGAEVVRVPVADAEERRAVAVTLGLAFHTDPVFVWCFPDGGIRARVLPRFFELVAGAAAAHGEIERTGDGRAAAIWVPPGQPPVADSQAAELEAALGRAVGDAGDRFFAVLSMLDEHHPTEPNRFLWFVGTRPEAQRLGLGTRLLTSLLAESDRQGVPTYLDASNDGSRRLYERHGFQVTATLSVDGSPPFWAMWREPEGHLLCQ